MFSIVVLVSMQIEGFGLVSDASVVDSLFFSAQNHARLLSYYEGDVTEAMVLVPASIRQSLLYSWLTDPPSNQAGNDDGGASSSFPQMKNALGWMEEEHLAPYEVELQQRYVVVQNVVSHCWWRWRVVRLMAIFFVALFSLFPPDDFGRFDDAGWFPQHILQHVTLHVQNRLHPGRQLLARAGRGRGGVLQQ